MPSERTIAWLVLVGAGLLEVVWAWGLRWSDGWRRPGPSLVTLAALVASMAGLSWAAQRLPLGTAYAVWTGIGAAGTAIVGMLVLGEPRHPLRIACLALIAAGTIGLHWWSNRGVE